MVPELVRQRVDENTARNRIADRLQGRMSALGRRPPFRWIHYAIFLAHNVNTLATSVHKLVKNGPLRPVSVVGDKHNERT
ncbi:hypothetical protein RWA06_25805 (plasmid) [Sinorhizobium meliloti]|uniref:hypothetical protein n=1 Tax=Rhizobium meliloti TaxID=382 RepID=UPI00299D56B4